MNMIDRQYRLGEHAGFVDLSEIRGPAEVGIPERWYILKVASQREFKVMREFGKRNISAWLPTIPVLQHRRRYKRGYEFIERRKILFPLISGGVIVPDAELAAGRWKNVPGVFGVYRMDQCTPFLNAKHVEQLRQIEAIGNVPRSKREHLFAIGELVRVINGPFKEFCGRVEAFDNAHRLTVGLEIFGRVTPVDLGDSDIVSV